MKKTTILLFLIGLFSINQAFAEACPETAFTTGSTIFVVYPLGTSDCVDRPVTITVGASTFNLLICEDGYSSYNLTSGPLVSPTDPFTIDTGFDTSCTFNAGVLGADEIALINRASLKLFPNPVNSSNELNIRFAVPISAKVNVYNLLGVPVMKDQLDNSNQKTLNISGLSAGMYLLRLDTGTTTLTRKFLVVN